MLQSGASTAPSWSTATWPATTTANQLLYSSANNVIAGLATANNGVLVTSSGGVPSISNTIPAATQSNISAALLPFTQAGTGAVLQTVDSKLKQIIDVRDYGTSCSATSTTGTISAGSASLTLASAIDFANGQGIRLNHAGAAFTLNAPTSLTVTPTGTTGSTHYQYQIASLDANGGIGAAITAVVTTTGNAALSSTNYNSLSWTAASGGATAYAVYGRTSGSTVLLAIVGGTTFKDVGAAAVTEPDWIPTAPQGSSLADWFVTSISSGGGTTALTLAGAATTAISGVAVDHDDTAGIQAAITKLQSGGGVANLPAGVCYTTSPLVDTVGGVSLIGKGRDSTIIEPIGMSSDDISIGSSSTIAAGDIIKDLQIARIATSIAGCTIRAVLADDLQLRNLYINYPFYGICLGGGAQMVLEDITLIGSTVNGSVVGVYGYKQSTNTTSAPSLPTQWFMTRVQAYGPLAAGFTDSVYLSATESLTVNSCNFGQNSLADFALVQDNTSTSGTISNINIFGTYFDIAAAYGLLISGGSNTNGDLNIWDIAITSSKFVGEGFQSASNQDGILVDGTLRSGKPYPYALSSFKLSNTSIYSWGAFCADIEGGYNVVFTGVQCNGNNYNANVGAAGAGVKLGAGLTGFTWAGGSSGHSYLGIGTPGAGAGAQTYGIYLVDGVANVSIGNVDLTGNSSGAVTDGTTAATTAASTITLVNNPGYNGGRPAAGPPFPASTVNQYNPYHAPAYVSIFGGTITNIALNGQTFTAGASAVLAVGAQDFVTVTYTGSPGWIWWPQ